MSIVARGLGALRQLLVAWGLGRAPAASTGITVSATAQLEHDQQVATASLQRATASAARLQPQPAQESASLLVAQVTSSGRLARYVVGTASLDTAERATTASLQGDQVTTAAALGADVEAGAAELAADDVAASARLLVDVATGAGDLLADAATATAAMTA